MITSENAIIYLLLVASVLFLLAPVIALVVRKIDGRKRENRRTGIGKAFGVAICVVSAIWCLRYAIGYSGILSQTNLLCWWEALLLPNITILAKDDKTNQLAKIMTAFEISGASKTVGPTLRKKELIYRLLGTIYRSNLQVSGGVNVNSKILEGVRLLEQTYLENLPITTFSDACHLSVNTFRKLFQEQVGMSPLKYRNYLRIERAKELLREGSFAVSEVAYNSGFENVGYFCRYYRKMTGENPKETKKY